MPDWLIWFLIGVALLATEALVAFTLYAGAVSLGAFPASLVAALGGSPELQVAVFAGGAAFSLLVLRPIARRQLDTTGTRTGTDNLIGAHAVVTETVTDDGGLVKIRGGEVWTARSLDSRRSFATGEEVVVREIRGVAAFVTASEPDGESDSVDG